MRRIHQKARIFCALFAAVVLSSCAIEPPSFIAPDLTFAQVRQIDIPVSVINIVSPQITEVLPTEASVEFPVPPQKAIEDLLRHQLVATGTSRRVLNVHIVQAEVYRRDLKRKSGIEAAFTVEPQSIYDMRVEIRMDMSDPSDTGSAYVTGRVTGDRQLTIMENDSPAQRDRTFFGMTEKMANDIAKSLDQIMHEKFLSAPEPWR
jgi:hypothetical protein